jgi:hypothetical protein
MEDAGGEKFTEEFKLAFDMNVADEILELTGLDLLNNQVWPGLNGRVLSAMLLAAARQNTPKWNTRDAKGEPTYDGLPVLRSYLNQENCLKALEALWDAYLLFLAPKERERLNRLREDMKAGRPTEQPDPQTPPAKSSADPTGGEQSGPTPDTTSDSAIAKSAS